MAKILTYDGTTATAEISLNDNSGNVKFTGIASVSWGLSSTPQKVWGTGQTPRDYTPGTLDVNDCSVELWLAEYENLVQVAGGEDNLRNKRFTLTLNYKPTDSNIHSQLISKKFENCRFTNFDHSLTTGNSDNLTVACTFMCLKLTTTKVQG